MVYFITPLCVCSHILKFNTPCGGEAENKGGTHGKKKKKKINKKINIICQ